MPNAFTELSYMLCAFEKPLTLLQYMQVFF